MRSFGSRRKYPGSQCKRTVALLRVLVVTICLSLTGGLAFTWQAAAMSSQPENQGSTKASASSQARRAAALTPPVKTAPANAIATRDNTPAFQWNPVTGATKYRVMVDNDADFSSPRVNKVVTATSFTPFKPLSDNRYYWRVQAGDASGGWSGWGTPWTFTIDTKPPPRPNLLTPANNSNTADNTPAFDWSSPAGATKYRLVIDNNGDFSSPERNLVIANSGLTLATPLPNCIYFWRVRARDAAGNWSAWSTVWVVIVDTNP